jgi:hypothetical protein
MILRMVALVAGLCIVWAFLAPVGDFDEALWAGVCALGLAVAAAWRCGFFDGNGKAGHGWRFAWLVGAGAMLSLRAAPTRLSRLFGRKDRASLLRWRLTALDPERRALLAHLAMQSGDYVPVDIGPDRLMLHTINETAPPMITVDMLETRVSREKAR